MSFITLRGPWCDSDAVNVHAPTEDKHGDTKDSFYEELGRVFDQFPEYQVRTVLPKSRCGTIKWGLLIRFNLYHESCHVGSCHHGMTRPRVAEVGCGL
jgi:hypothetical protein